MTMSCEQTSTSPECGTCQKPECRVKNRHADESQEQYQERMEIASRMCQIGHKIVVMSGKGGVGKSTVAVALAVTLSRMGKRVGLLDVDVHGPSVPTLLGLATTPLCPSPAGGLMPVAAAGLQVMSVGLLLEDRNTALIWRGPRKQSLIKQFLRDVEWGELDYLIIDAPPGTGDEPLAICQAIETLDGAVIVTTPQEVALADVRRSISFCRELGTPILGVVENMSGFVCPTCGDVTHIFNHGGGETLAAEMEVPFLGRIPIDPAVGRGGDGGTPMLALDGNTGMGQAFAPVVATLCQSLLNKKGE